MMADHGRMIWLRKLIGCIFYYYAVSLYDRLQLSFRHVEELLAELRIEVSFQAMSKLAAKFGRRFSSRIRRRSAGGLRIEIFIKATCGIV